MPAPVSSRATAKLATVFGGSGFVGRHVVRALVRRGWRVIVAVRHPERANFLQPLGQVGQIRAVQANLRFPWSVERAVAGSDAVVNLVGVLAERGKQRFDAVHAEGAAAVAAAAKAAGAGALVQVSAIGAHQDSDSLYFRSKAAGEAAVLSAFPGAVVMRPSIQFGPEDSFFNRFAEMARLSPVLPLIGGDTKFQPVFVGDVAAAVAKACDREATPGAVYELGGPEVETFADLLRLMLRVIDRRRLLLPIPTGIASLLGSILQNLPGQMLTADQVRQLQVDNLVAPDAEAEGRTLQGLGIEPTSMAAVLPSYLVRFRPQGQFQPRGSVGDG
jgi:NADH dehydrogenase